MRRLRPFFLVARRRMGSVSVAMWGRPRSQPGSVIRMLEVMMLSPANHVCLRALGTRRVVGFLKA
jgi:hypothetical protein